MKKKTSKNITATSSLLRNINRSAILELIRRHSPISRSQIAETLCMSMPTVMRIINELIEEDLVVPLDSMETTKGRPRSLIKFNAESYVVLGVDLSGPDMVGEIATLSGAIQHEVVYPYQDADPETHVRFLLDLIYDLLKFPLRPNQHIRGIGIGAPGATIYPDGIVTWAPIFGWKDLHLREILSNQFNLPIVVENDVKLATLGELGFGAGVGRRNIVCIMMGVGIGAGIIIDGSLYRGTNHYAGEIACMVPGIQYLGKSYDQFGPLGNLISEIAIEDKAKEYVDLDIKNNRPRETLVESIFNAARKNQPWAKKIVDELTDYLGLMIANVVSLLDPELIILGGILAPASDLLVEPLADRVKGIVRSVPTIVGSKLHHRAVVLGAVNIILTTTTEQTVVQRLP
ncbi:MAG: ROK family transcriptional regulator [Spirochaetaceae bacterium]|nr:MAG: ROK family transcriptional regulator [Spirochaetaceae bacterium]